MPIPAFEPPLRPEAGEDEGLGEFDAFNDGKAEDGEVELELELELERELEEVEL